MNAKKNVIVVGDINLPKVDWKQGIVIKPENSTDKWLNMQNELLDLFITKGFSWFIEEQKPRIRNVNGSLQQSTLDQVFTNNAGLINSVEITAPLGKSDHVSMMVEVNSSINLDYVTTKRKNWYKVDKEFVATNANKINWGMVIM